MKFLIIAALALAVTSVGAVQKRILWTKDGSLCRSRGGSCVTKASCTCTLPMEADDCPSTQTCCTTCFQSQAPSLPTKCGLQNYDSRIVGGVQATQGAWPWAAVINVDGGLMCAASIINEKWLVSAGHCFEDNKALTRLSVTLGDHNRGVNHGTEQRFAIEKIITYPLYDDDNIVYDLSLIKIKGTATYNNYVSPICLPESTVVLTGQSCTVAGWGRTSFNAASATILRQVTVPILTDAQCRAKFPRNYINTDVEICAGQPTGIEDSCYGDSGGPMSCSMGGKWYLGGAVSWGYSCQAGGVYTRVSFFNSWIKGIISVH